LSEIKVSDSIVAASKLIGEGVIETPKVEEAVAEPPMQQQHRQRVQNPPRPKRRKTRLTGHLTARAAKTRSNFFLFSFF
jgi:hypothetical protein